MNRDATGFLPHGVLALHDNPFKSRPSFPADNIDCNNLPHDTIGLFIACE